MGNASGISLAYDVGDQVDYVDKEHHWQMLEGCRKKDFPLSSSSTPSSDPSLSLKMNGNVDSDVTIFRLDKKLQGSRGKLPVGQRAWSKIRTLKHPSVLCFIDGVDLEDSIMLVTERCQPLESWLSERRNLLNSRGVIEGEVDAEEESKAMLVQELMWGFRCVIEALQFLHTVGQLSHGYLGPHALFVTRSGDWKVGALDLCCNLAIPDDLQFAKTYAHLLPKQYLSPERKQLSRCNPGDDVENVTKTPPGSADIYSLACCMNEVFERAGVDMPSDFAKYFQKMQSVDPKRRPPASQLFKAPVFNTDHIMLLSSLGELSIKPPSESLEIIGQLSTKVGGIPKSVCLHKILPALARALQMAVNDFSNRDSREACRQSVQSSVGLLAQLGQLSKLDENNFVGRLGGIIVQLWTMSDRAVRSSLLKSLKSLAPYTPADLVSRIFDSLLAGFADSSAKMREETLKSLVVVVDKLDERNLQEKLVRSIVQLQQDGEASIRTNATIFLGRISPKLKEGVRVRVLCNSFVKSMRDNFMHCRVAGLKAAIASLSLLDHPQLTNKVMPQACVLLLDRSAVVRELACVLLESATVLMRQNHEKLTESENLERSKERSASSSAVSTSTALASSTSLPTTNSNGTGWSWAVDGLSKSIEKATSTSVPVQSSTFASPAVSTSSSASAPITGSSSSSSSSSSSANSAKLALSSNKLGIPSSSSSSSNANLKTPAIDDDEGGWEDDDWGDNNMDDQNTQTTQSFQQTQTSRGNSFGLGVEDTNPSDEGIAGWDDDLDFDEAEVDKKSSSLSLPPPTTSQIGSKNSTSTKSTASSVSVSTNRLTSKTTTAPAATTSTTTIAKSAKKTMGASKLAVSKDTWDDF